MATLICLFVLIIIRSEKTVMYSFMFSCKFLMPLHDKKYMINYFGIRNNLYLGLTETPTGNWVKGVTIERSKYYGEENQTGNN